MRAPSSWERPGAGSPALLPLALLWAWGARRRARRPGRAAPVPVVCAGSLVAGGSGKTPVARALAERLRNSGARPHALARGYGGRLRGPVRVDPARHSARDVGDEALLLARTLPAWVARDRPRGAAAAAAAGASALVLDDGFQDPSLRKDLALLVFDGGYGIGNGRVIPAGPLRERPADGGARAHGAVIVGDDERGVAGLLPPGLPVVRARMTPGDGADALRGRRVYAFAGIARPAKFFRTLEELGAEVAGTRAFPDHHPYRRRELERVVAAAARADAVPVTTEKDMVRIPPDLAGRVVEVRARLRFEDPGVLDSLLAPVLEAAARAPGAAP